MGSRTTALISRARCRTACLRGERNREVRWAYRYPASSSAWKNSRQVFQTAGLPPSSGRTIFVNIGWTENSSAALKKIAVANTESSNTAAFPVRDGSGALDGSGGAMDTSVDCSADME